MLSNSHWADHYPLLQQADVYVGNLVMLFLAFHPLTIKNLIHLSGHCVLLPIEIQTLFMLMAFFVML